MDADDQKLKQKNEIVNEYAMHDDDDDDVDDDDDDDDEDELHLHKVRSGAQLRLLLTDEIAAIQTF